MNTLPDDLCDCRPILRVENVARSLDYYVGMLGFRPAWAWSDSVQRFLCAADPQEPTFACVVRGRVQLMLSQQNQGAPGMWLHLDVRTAQALDDLHAEWTQRGAHIIEPPCLRPWGMYELRLQDLDGHVLRVSAPPAE